MHLLALNAKMAFAIRLTVNVNAILTLTLTPILTDRCRITQLLDKAQGK